MSKSLQLITHYSSLITASSINFPEHNIDRANDGDHVGDHLAFRHQGQGREVDETRAAKMDARGLRAAVGFDVAAEFALRAFNRVVDFAFGHVEAFGHNQE